MSPAPWRGTEPWRWSSRVIAVVLGLSIGYWVAHKLALGLGQVANVAQLAPAVTIKLVQRFTSKDELGQMAASFNAMLDVLRPW